jgi:hypothetical protein
MEQVRDARKTGTRPSRRPPLSLSALRPIRLRNEKPTWRGGCAPGIPPPVLENPLSPTDTRCIARIILPLHDCQSPGSPASCACRFKTCQTSFRRSWELPPASLLPLLQALVALRRHQVIELMSARLRASLVLRKAGDVWEVL